MRFFYLLVIILVLLSCESTGNVKSEFPIDSHSIQIDVGSIEAQFDTVTSLGKLKKSEVSVSYYPVEDLVCLRFRNDFITYYQYWYKTSRQAFLSSLERYKSDYELRNLPKTNKSSREYSQVDSFLIWESAKISTKGRSFPKINIGYILKEKSPYFTLSQLEATNMDSLTQREKVQNNRQILYFTRAQADNLAALFDHGYLDTLKAPVDILEDDDPYEEIY